MVHVSSTIAIAIEIKSVFLRAFLPMHAHAHEFEDCNCNCIALATCVALAPDLSAGTGELAGIHR
jgi:hypothetical protein